MPDFPNNKFDISTSWGDSDPVGINAENDNAADFAQDSKGVPNVNQGEQTPMDLALEPNKFPRETGHDSLTEEEAYLS
jgi:hypothetical protein